MTENLETEVIPERTVAFGEWFRLFLIGRAGTLSALLAVVTILSWGARGYWALDLLSHFPVQIAATALVPLAILLGLRQWKAAILPAVVFALSAAQVLPLYVPAEQPSYSGTVIRAVSANVLCSNRQYAKFNEYIRATRPDFFLVMEVDETWLAELQSLSEEYPYRVAQAGQGAFGIALMSRMPIEDYQVIESTTAKVPMIRATLSLGERHLHFLGVHPLPPIRSGNSEMRNGQLREIAALAAPLPAPRLLLGDLNITSWSPYFADLLDQTSLRDGRKGFGVQPTWPGLPWLARIPIDHTLVSDDVEVVARRVGPDVGSDHRPVEIEFRIGE